jgi:tetratricopeptide (TPR) repeat protein
MAVGGDRLRFFGVGAVVLVLAAMSLTELPVEPDAQPPVSDKIPEMIAEIQSGAAEEKAEATANEPGLVALASPCLMRRPRLALGVAQSWRHGFAAATIATAPEQRVAMLDALMATAPDDLSRWRTDIALVEVAIRSDNTLEAKRHLENAVRRDVPDTCRADEAFYAATLVEDPQAATALLARAVEIDPGFWSALEQLALLSAVGTGGDLASCEADAVRTLETVLQLGALAQKDTQFQRLNRELETMPVNGRSALLRGMILRQTGETEAARSAYQQGLASLGTSACDAILRQGLMGMLTATESDT